MLSTVFFNQSLNSTLIEALMVSTSNYEMRGSLFLGIDASFNLKFRIAYLNYLIHEATEQGIDAKVGKIGHIPKIL